MSAPPLAIPLMRQVLDALAEHGSQNAASIALGIPRATFQSRLTRAQAWQTMTEYAPPAKAFEIDALPGELPTADELLTRRSQQFSKKKIAHEARSLVPVKIGIDGPFGVALFGDPHVDDNGTDIDLLRRHVAVVNSTDALFAGNIGDFSNNWVGRLARLYGQQSTSAAEAWVLVEWLVRSCHWLFLIGGNHDCWSGSGDPIKWMARQARVQYEAHGMRLGLTTPNKRVIRLNARHDFGGRSQWNTAHGPAKAAQLGWRDHILVCGHTHVSGHQVLRDPATGLISHALRVGSYKTFDSYADERGLPNQTFMTAPVVIVRPQFSDDDNRLITVCYDPATGADFLTWLRKRKSERAA